MTRTFTLATALVGGAAVKMATQFESSMSKITGLVGVASDQVDAWSKQLITLGPEVGKSPQELADALFFVTSAGLRGSEAIDTLTVSAKAAAAGLGETKDVADAATSALNAYGTENITAQQAVDVLTATVREGKLEASDLAGSLGRVIPVAAQMGVNFNEVGAAIASLTRIGFSADEAVTSLQASMSGLLKPTTQTEELLKKIGTSAEEVRANIKDKGLLATLQDLSDRVDGDTAAMAELFPNVRALRGVLGLVGKNAKSTADIMSRMADVTGTTQTAFEEATKTAEFRYARSLSKVKGAAIQLGNSLKGPLADAFEAVATKIAAVGNWFSGLSDNTKTLILSIAGIVAAIGPALLVLAGLVRAFGFISTAFSAMGKLLAAAWPWGVLIAAVATVAYIVVKNWDAIAEGAKQLWARLTSIFNHLKDGLVNGIKGFAKIYVGSWLDIFETIGKAFSDFGEKIGQSAAVIFDPSKWGQGGLKKIWADGVTDAFSGAFQTAGDRMKTEGVELARQAGEDFSSAWRETAALVSDSVKIITDGAKSVGSSFMGMFSSKTGGATLVTDFDQLSASIDKSAEAVHDTRVNTQELADTTDTAIEGVKSMQDIMEDLAKNTIDGLASSFEQLGYAIVAQGGAWEDYGKIALKVVADVIRAMAKTFAANAALFAIAGMWGKAGRSLAAAAGLYIVAGGLDAIADSFATGGSFETSGPQLMVVGDNASGRERVDVQANPSDNSGAQALPKSVTLVVDGKQFTAHFQQQMVNGKLSVPQRAIVRK